MTDADAYAFLNAHAEEGRRYSLDDARSILRAIRDVARLGETFAREREQAHKSRKLRLVSLPDKP